MGARGRRPREAAALEALRCPSCVAPLAAAAGGVVQQCGYCGTPLRVGSGGELTDVLEFAATEAQVRAAVQQRFGVPRDEEVAVGRVYVPAMFVSAKAETRWSAEIGKQYKDGSWKWTPKTGGPIRRTWRDVCVLAADGPWSAALSELERRALAAVPLRPDHLQGATVLEVEGTARQREARASEAVRVRQEVEAAKTVAGAVRGFACTTDVRDLEIHRVLVPVWVFEVHREPVPIRGFVDDGTLRPHAVSGLSHGPMAALLAALVASPAVVAVIALVALGAFCCLCCAGAPQEERAPRPAPAPAVEAPAPTPQPPGTLRVVARCEVTGFGPDGEPKVVGHVQPGDLVRPVAEDDKSVRVEQADGTPAWVPRRCVESH